MKTTKFLPTTSDGQINEHITWCEAQRQNIAQLVNITFKCIFIHYSLCICSHTFKIHSQEPMNGFKHDAYIAASVAVFFFRSGSRWLGES
jgi:hypothetical protein